MSSPKIGGQGHSSVHIDYTTEDGEESSTEVVRLARGRGPARQLDLEDGQGGEYRNMKEVKVSQGHEARQKAYNTRGHDSE